VPTDTISALATPPGIGGVGIVRVSGPLVTTIAAGITGHTPKPRRASFRPFLAADGTQIDQGIALFFPAPHSFTGEDVLELQGHGGPVVMDLLLRRTLELGARVARPGEFSERAFLNGRMDLVQAEAVADLIESTTETAARLASRTLQGELSRRVHVLEEGLVRLRTLTEATMDFPDEQIDLIPTAQLTEALQHLLKRFDALIASAHQGQIVREGLRLVIAGPPNAGKSSLLNALSRSDVAIVTPIPGTTRDILRQEIQIDGIPLHVIDTAGLRDSADPIEVEGVRRAKEQLQQADRILWVFDGVLDPKHAAFDPTRLPPGVPVTFIRNKVDLAGTSSGERDTPAGHEIALSALTGAGLDLLREHLKAVAGFRGNVEGEFLARRRHLTALQRARDHLQSALRLVAQDGARELLAEDLRLGHRALGEITGEFSSDDLLGSIFSTFCIGK
jgi:tRNA modification GTPase